jgi:hypothetical protein
MASDPIPDLDTGAVRAACVERMRSTPSGDPRSLPALLDRLDPSRWTLEWHLPWWLGHAFGLRADVAFELVVSDVLGLASIRLEDDIVDGNIPEREGVASRELSRALYAAALRPYRDWFEPGHGLWVRIDAWMAEWRGVTSLDALEPPDASDDAETVAATRRLAARATPLRIPAYAVCALSDRLADFATVDRCLDHALAALVLYDHLVDREDDLEGGRWNALVAAASPLPQTPEHLERNRVALSIALMTDGAAARLGRRIEAEMTQAAALSDGLGSPPLTDYLLASGARARHQALEVEAHYARVADEATRLLFGDRDGPGERSGDAGQPTLGR